MYVIGFECIAVVCCHEEKEKTSVCICQIKYMFVYYIWNSTQSLTQDESCYRIQ